MVCLFFIGCSDQDYNQEIREERNSFHLSSLIATTCCAPHPYIIFVCILGTILICLKHLFLPKAILYLSCSCDLFQITRQIPVMSDI